MDKEYSLSPGEKQGADLSLMGGLAFSVLHAFCALGLRLEYILNELNVFFGPFLPQRIKHDSMHFEQKCAGYSVVHSISEQVNVVAVW